MDDKQYIKQLRIALSMAAMFARENPPAHIPDNMTIEEFQYLYVGQDDDIFGDRFVAYWLQKAKELIK